MDMSSSRGRHSSYTPNSLLALSWLGSDDQGASILTTAHDLLAAQQAIAAALPAGLADCCRVARIDGNTLTIAVPAAAHANKLRHMQTRLTTTLHEAGWNIEQIQIRVQGSLAALHPTRVREIQPLDDQALQAFDNLKDNVDAGPLADAIRRLLQRHGGS